MNNKNKLLVLLFLALLMLAPACGSIASPSPTPTSTPEPTATATSTPKPSPTATPTSTMTSTPTSTPTPTPTLTPTPTKAPTSTPTSVATTDPIPDRQSYSSTGLRLSIAYPGTWLLEDKGTSMTIASPDLAASNRTKGAELIIALGSPKRPDESLQAEWKTAIAAFPEVTFGEPVVITIGGEEAYRAVFTDPRDGSHGWFIVLRHDGFLYVIVAQAFPTDAWTNYESTFRAMMYTLWFS